MADVDALVVGAGVVGLAVARALAAAGLSTLIVEAEERIGSGTSSRNSEVIHAGLYYPTGSLKARLCVAGHAQLLDYCDARGIAHCRCGKLIVATRATEVPTLEALERQAAANGVAGVTLIDGASARALEPALAAHAALMCAPSGIVDSHALMTSLLGDAENDGAVLAARTRIARIEPRGGRFDIWIEGEGEPVVSAAYVVNAAGLGAHAVAAGIVGLPAAANPPAFLAKGSYFAYSGRQPFGRLIYPVPEPGGLGTHLTIDLAGAGRLGPDVEWVDEIDYDVDASRRDRFAAAARTFWPTIEADRLHPAYAGIRPKLAGPGEPAADFRIDGPAEHGLAGLVNLFGIESPGLTASLVIGELVAQRLTGQAPAYERAA